MDKAISNHSLASTDDHIDNTSGKNNASANVYSWDVEYGAHRVGGQLPLLENHGGSQHDKLRTKGLPMCIFHLLKRMSCLCRADYWFVFPLILVIGLCAFGTAVALAEGKANNILYRVLLGFFSFLLLVVWIKWAMKNPRVPDHNDVARFSVCAGVDSWPKAPVAPVRGEVNAKGGSWFKDREGRRMLLRGINLSGGCKMPLTPVSASATHLNEAFCDYKGVSFVGRPFPLEEADFHLGRLRAMGLTFLRFLITWEAVEHDGPYQYDQKYLIYLRDVIRKCADHGISVFIDAHQDVWSRWTGGDGAPAWTLEKVGFALDQLDESSAACTQQNWKDGPATFPKMVWNSNNSRLAAGTMWTLFFAGDDFLPNTKIDGEPAQQYLQRHFCQALAQVAIILQNEPNVVGFDLLNEPSVGFVGIEDARDIGPNQFYVGWRVDPWTAMKTGAGFPCVVNYFSSFMVIDGTRKLNPTRACAWKNGPTTCVWHQNGVWKMDESTGEPLLLKPKHFATNPRTGLPIDFLHDYAIPFWKNASKAIRTHMPDAIIFAEPVLDMTDPSLKERPVLTEEEVGAGYVWGKHYYDGITLMTKAFSRYVGLDPVTQRPSIGMKSIQKAYGRGIAQFKEETTHMGGPGGGGCPVLVGECGIPFDLHDERRNKKGDGGMVHDFRKCTHALNTTMRALEHAQVSYTIWTYAQENTNEYGDGWNGEDLSLFSQSQIIPGDEDSLFAGGRSLLAAIRPYPSRVAGDVISHSFHLYRKDRAFQCKFHADDSLATKETQIFLPRYQYPHGVHVLIDESRGTFQLDWEMQTLFYYHNEGSGVHSIVVKKKMEESISC